MKNRIVKKILRIIFLVLVGAAVIGTFYFLWKKAQPVITVYEVVTPSRDTIETKTVATGKVEPRDEVLIKPQMSGIISELLKEAGQMVKEGEIIARIKVIPEMVQLNSAESRVRVAKISLDQISATFKRDEELHKQGVISKEDYETFGRVLTPQIELYGKTCGIFGLGAIGFAFAKMAQGFGMRVISYSRHKKTDPKYDFIEQVDFDTLLAESDVISIHAPLTPSTEDTFDADAFAKMKDGTILINTARGGLIVEEALVDALQSGKVYGAGLDVIRDEPPKGDNPLLHQDNAAITAHIAWLTRASRLRAIDIAIDNFKAYLRGEPVSVINK